MNLQTDLPGWLNRCSCPGFAVKNNIITHCNQAAEAMLLTPGTDVRELLAPAVRNMPLFKPAVFM